MLKKMLSVILSAVFAITVFAGCADTVPDTSAADTGKKYFMGYGYDENAKYSGMREISYDENGVYSGFCDIPEDYGIDDAAADGCVTYWNDFYYAGREAIGLFCKKAAAGEDAFIRVAGYRDCKLQFVEDIYYSDGKPYVFYEWNGTVECISGKYFLELRNESDTKVAGLSDVIYVISDRNDLEYGEFVMSIVRDYRAPDEWPLGWMLPFDTAYRENSALRVIEVCEGLADVSEKTSFSSNSYDYIEENIVAFRALVNGGDYVADILEKWLAGDYREAYGKTAYGIYIPLAAAVIAQVRGVAEKDGYSPAYLWMEEHKDEIYYQKQGSGVISLDDIFRLSQKGEALTVSDVLGVAPAEDTGSGLYVFRYDVYSDEGKGEYIFTVGGGDPSLSEALLYAILERTETGESIDIRDSEFSDFIAK